MKDNRYLTKRKLLRFLMIVYDPKCLLSHYLVYVRILLQKIWRTGVNGNDKLPEEFYQIWKLWLEVLLTVENVQVSRYHQLTYRTPRLCWREWRRYNSRRRYASIIINDCFHGFIVSSKTGVALIHSISIPKNELTLRHWELN